MQNFTPLLLIFSVVIVLSLKVSAQTVWSTGSLTFVKTMGGEKDCITPQTCLTRITVLFNDVCEAVSGREGCNYPGPCNTEWSFGNIANWNTLNYQPLYSELVNDCNPSGIIGDPLVAHLIAEDIYLQITFNSWQSGGGGGFSYTRTTAGALPVSISRFAGFKTNNSNVLEWTSSAELNNRFYMVERSSNGVDFATLGRVNSLSTNGTSSTALNYRFEDDNPQWGYNYYRLQQVDINGRKYYSDVVKLLVTKDANKVTLSQVLAPAKAILNIYSETAAAGIVRLRDANGRLLKDMKTGISTGTNTVSMSMDGIAAGIYIIQLYENGVLSFTGKITRW